MAKYRNDYLTETLNLTKALADENRVRALMALESGELCVCRIVELLQLSPSTVSKHMSILQQAGLVECRKAGRWHYYRLPTESRSPQIQALLEWVQQSLHPDKQIKTDRKQLQTILKAPLKELCSRNSKNKKA